jgi:hypothetical protein
MAEWNPHLHCHRGQLNSGFVKDTYTRLFFTTANAVTFFASLLAYYS